MNAQSYAGCTALHVASGRGLLDALRLLVRNGADCGIKNYHNDTALMVAKNRRVSGGGWGRLAGGHVGEAAQTPLGGYGEGEAGGIEAWRESGDHGNEEAGMGEGPLLACRDGGVRGSGVGLGGLPAGQCNTLHPSFPGD